MDLFSQLLEWVASNPAPTAGILTSMAIVFFAAVTWRESKRQAGINYIMHQLEEFTGPLLHELDLHEWVMFPPEEPHLEHTWWNNIVPLFRKYRYLASRPLNSYYSVLLKDAGVRRDDAWVAKRFKEKVKEDYTYQVRKLRRLTGAESRVIHPLLKLLRVENWIARRRILQEMAQWEERDASESRPTGTKKRE